ncbi:MAG: plasmid stabilization protein, partial [Halobacteriales archaeon]
LRRNDENMLLASKWDPADGIVDETPRPRHHSAMLWFLSDLVSLARNGWFGYANPEPLIPPENLQAMLDGVAKTTMNAFGPSDVVAAGSTRDLGEFLGAVGWYGTHAGSADLRSMAGDYADALAASVEANMTEGGRVEGGTANQAATQGAVVQGLLWASQVDGVDHVGTAESALKYLLETLWDEAAGTFASGIDDSIYRITARDAADVTGAINAADAVLDRTAVRDVYAQFYNQTFNRGRLQRAERPPSRDAEAEFPLPLPPDAGGEHGQSAVYNAAVEYDPGADQWTVTDARFDTAQSLYLANQDIWLGQWGGDFFRGRGVPGRTDEPPA